MSHPQEQPSPEHGLPIESNDDAILRMLGGANFGPDARLILPSGTELSGTEAQAFTSAFADSQPPEPAAPATEPMSDESQDNPLSSRHDAWTGDPEVDRGNLVMRALRAIRRNRNS